MYTMISEYGNEIAYAEDEKTKERLINLGFKVKEEPKKRTSGKGAKKNEAEDTDRA